MNVAKSGGLRLPAKVLLSLSPEMHAQLKREAELLQSTVAGVARHLIARSLSQNAARSGDDEKEARAA